MGQRAVVGLRDVGDLQLRGVGLGPGPHRADQRIAPFERGGDQRQFRREGVDGVHHIVVTRGIEQRVGLLVLDVAIDHRESDRGVDVPQPFGQHLGLLPPDGRVERHQLAVDVRRVHRVGIGHRHAAYARTGDHLGGIGAHAAQTDDQNVGVADL